MIMNETLMESLTENQWKIAHAIAQSLVQENADVNELGKAIAYLRNAVNQNQSDAGSKFFKYLKTLVSNGRQIGHSGKTSDYYRSIDKVCSQYLQNQSINADTLLQILGWSARLMRYYKEGGLIENIATPISQVNSLPKPQISQSKTSSKYKEGQIVDATVIDRVDKVIDSKKTKSTIIYEIDGERLGKPEEIYNMEKKGISLNVADVVKLLIIEVKDDQIKKFERTVS
ncbi:MAG: hypothetical protein WBV73_17420 [Phormidium sp.]